MQCDEKCGQRNEHRRIELGKKYNLHPLTPLRIFERHSGEDNLPRRENHPERDDSLVVSRTVTAHPANPQNPMGAKTATPKDGSVWRNVLLYSSHTKFQRFQCSALPLITPRSGTRVESSNKKTRIGGLMGSLRVPEIISSNDSASEASYRDTNTSELCFTMAITVCRRLRPCSVPLALIWSNQGWRTETQAFRVFFFSSSVICSPLFF